MSSQMKTYLLVALCSAAVLLTGCFPEDSLEWSDDGSVGLLRFGEKVFLVDGQSGQVTQVPIEGEAGIMPDISADGERIAYVRARSCSDVEEGLRAFSPMMANRIKREAKQLAERIMGEYVFPQDLPASERTKAGWSDEYHHWVIRTMVKDPSAELATRIGADKLAECRQCELTIDDLIVADRAHPENGDVLTSAPTTIFRPRFSPNANHVAYLVTEPNEDYRASLAVAAVAGDKKAMLVAEAVGIGFDWRPDGKALGYVKQDGDEILAVVKETVVIDDNGRLIAGELDVSTGIGLYALYADGQAQQFAGTLFSPMMYVQYGVGGRVLFSSAAAEIPTSDLDEPEYSLFCYDRVTGTVTSILPGILQNQASATMSFFSLSPDRTRLLVSLPSNRFAVYELGSKEAVLPLREEEGFGEDELPKFLPKWKGNDQITCLVSETNHFLTGDDGQPHGREEIVVLDLEGKLVKVLSADWPAEMLAPTEN